MSLTWLSHSALHSAMDATDIPPLSDVVLAQTVVSISYWRDGAHGGDGGGGGEGGGGEGGGGEGIGGEGGGGECGGRE